MESQTAVAYKCFLPCMHRHDGDGDGCDGQTDSGNSDYYDSDNEEEGDEDDDDDMMTRRMTITRR